MKTTEKPTTALIQPYLFFDGTCEEALEFYRANLGAEITMMMRFRDNPDPSGCGTQQEGQGDKVMHASFVIGETTVMASDGQCGGKPEFKGFALSLTLPDAAAAERAFQALSEGGQVEMPLGETFFSPCFGMVADRFGVFWMVIVVH